MKDTFQPGTSERGERYNDLPNAPEDFPPSHVDLGRTTGTDHENHYKTLFSGRSHRPANGKYMERHADV